MSHHTSFPTHLRSALLLFAVLMGSTPAHDEPLAGKELVAALRSGGYVILMRHASSPRNLPDPAPADVENVNHERQLDEEGRASARALGEALRRVHIPIGAVWSSPTYRALQTIKLARLWPATTFEELGDGGQSMRADRTGARANWLKAKAVTHFPDISEAYPQDASGLADGEALVLRPDGRVAATVVARVKIDEWPSMAR
jgi:phosphohistidine phosphatase SixA